MTRISLRSDKLSDVSMQAAAALNWVHHGLHQDNQAMSVPVVGTWDDSSRLVITHVYDFELLQIIEAYLDFTFFFLSLLDVFRF